MGRFRPEKLHVRFADGLAGDPPPAAPRRYTLTHSDRTGDLFLTIGPEHDRAQIAHWYTRLMRDEVLAEWLLAEAAPALHVYLHVSGGFVFGTGAFRAAIFRRELPLALAAICHGDGEFLDRNPGYATSPVWVHFRARQPRLRSVEAWGCPADYRLGR